MIYTSLFLFHSKKYESNNKMIKFSILFVSLLVLLSLYGYFEKERSQKLLNDFKMNKPILYSGKKIRFSEGWIIHNNRFFTNGEEFYTIIFCKSIKE